MFVDRESEFEFLNHTFEDDRAQLILLYGRRRVGKTQLLLHWAKQSEKSYTYWSAEKESASLQRRKLYSQFKQIPIDRTPLFHSWAELWQMIANEISDKPHVLILDELPYAIESDPATLSALQHAWDHHFQHSQLSLIVCGSQVQIMEAILNYQSPLFGRLTGQWHLQALPFYCLSQFFPSYSEDELVALYAVVGGVPAYLNWLKPKLQLSDNIRNVILRGGSMFLAEPMFLLYDEVREPQSYLSILRAIGAGNHTLSELKNTTMLATSQLSPYLSRLQDLKLVERRLPLLLPPIQRRKSRRSRYHLRDAYFRFYFRFIAPFATQLPFYTEPVLAKIRQEFSAFIGTTVFEELAHEWVMRESQRGRITFTPEYVGRHWSREVQIDVAAVNWHEKRVLLGECKWGDSLVSKQVVRELFERKTPRVRKELAKYSDSDWQIEHLFFARKGFTRAAIDYLTENNATAITLPQLLAGISLD